MRKTIIATLFVLALASFSSCTQEKGQTVGAVNIGIYFSPNGGCTEAIISEINKAKSDVRVQAYSFTSQAIAQAIVEAYKRGIPVEIILDKSNVSHKYGAGDFTSQMKIPTFIDGRHAIAHNKVIVIDGETVITGSFNFTRAAEEKNAENLLIIKSPEIAQQYLKNWEQHKDHSIPYRDKSG